MGRRTGLQTTSPTRRGAEPFALVSVSASEGPGKNPDDVLSAMAAAVARENPASAAEALRTLRAAYPHHPLALRLAALALAMKRTQPTGGMQPAEPA